MIMTKRRQTAIVSRISRITIRRHFAIILILIILPMTACERYKARHERRRAEYFAELLKRVDAHTIGEDKFFEENLLANPYPEVRIWCATALGRIASPQALPLLYRALHEGDAVLRAASAFAIGEIEDKKNFTERAPDPQAGVELLPLLDDPSFLVRMRSVEALGKIGSESEAREIVRRINSFTSAGDMSERAYLGSAIIALGRLSNPCAIPFLEREAGSNDPERQWRALDVLARMQVKSAIPLFNQNLDSPHPQVRYYAKHGLAALQNQTVGQTDMVPASTDESNELHRSSITEAGAQTLAYRRRNITIATIETNRGAIEIELFREDAPVTADNFVLMSKRGLYNGIKFSQVLPHQRIEMENLENRAEFRRGIRNEINLHPFERGRVGMTISGRNAHSGLFFITLGSQPYLDGVTTCFGHVISGMQVVDKIAPGDRIQRITIKETLRIFDKIKFN
jgi:peptidyl-prolyl cis-trans isomerase B (cyclophilin B)